MTQIADPPTNAPAADMSGPLPASDPERQRPFTAQIWLGRAKPASRWALAIAGALIIFSAFLLVNGADPIEVLDSMWRSASDEGFGETFIRMTPFLLGALAVAVPARAGLFNIGGEGQLLLGAVGGMLIARSIGPDLGGFVGTTLILAGGAVAGGLWALIPAVLKVWAKSNEAITSLLLNYCAGLLLTWLVFEPWKDPASLGQAYSTELGPTQELPVIWGNRVHLGVIIAIGAAVAMWAILRYTRWGFRLRVLGGNPEAARRAGLAVGGLTLSAFFVGGALAGLGGAIELAGVEGRLRPDLLVGYGYIGFLASWLVGHHPLRVIGSSFLLAAIAVGGTGLKIAAGLSGGAVNVLMALILLAVLGWGRGRPKAKTDTGATIDLTEDDEPAADAEHEPDAVSAPSGDAPPASPDPALEPSGDPINEQVVPDAP